MCFLFFFFGGGGDTIYIYVSQPQLFSGGLRNSERPPRQPFDFYRSAMRGYSSAIPARQFTWLALWREVMCGLLSGATYFEGPELPAHAQIS